MSDFDFSSGKQFSRLTLARAETLNARFSEAATAIASKLDKTGGSITGPLSVSGDFSVGGTFAVTGAATFGSTVTLAGAPTLDLHPATKKYADDLSALKLSLSGGTMSGTIAMGGNKITGGGTASDPGDYITKAYADALAFSATLPGITGIATQAEAEAGTVADKVMTPQRTKQAITALAPPAGQRTFTATGTLPNGATVVLNSDGTVSTVTSNNDTTGTAAVFRSAATTYIASAALSATQVVVCYLNGTNGAAIIGTISGTSVTFGSEVTFNAGSTDYISVAALSGTSFCVAYRNGATNFGSARVGSVSGTTITFPSAAATFNSANTAFISIAALSSTAVVIAYQDTGNSSYGTAIIGTISGTTISFPGSEYVFANGTSSAISIAALSSTSFVVAHDRASSVVHIYAGSVSGTAITYGASTSADSSACPYTSIVALTSTTFMVAWARSTTDCRAKIGTVSGTTVSFTGASDVVFNNAQTGYITAVKMSATSVIITFTDYGNSTYGTLIVGSVSGLSISFASKIVIRSAISNLWTGSCAIGSSVFVGYQDGGNSSYGTGVVFQPAFTNVAKWIGITAASIANGASGLVTMKGGGIATNLSGLTTDTEYYLANDGTLTTTQTSYKVGRAVNATTIPLTGNA